MKKTKDAGFFIRLFFVCTEAPEINVRRVARRYLEGGHEEPISKVVSRYYKSLMNLHCAAPIVDRLYVYDNSIEDQAPRLLFRISGGKLAKLYEREIPEWAELLLRRSSL